MVLVLLYLNGTFKYFHFQLEVSRNTVNFYIQTLHPRTSLNLRFSSSYGCSGPKLCLTLHNPMNCSIPGFPVLHCFPEFAQTHVHWVGNAIQPSHPLSPPSPPALNLSQQLSSSNFFIDSLEFFCVDNYLIYEHRQFHFFLSNEYALFPLDYLQQDHTE